MQRKEEEERELCNLRCFSRVIINYNMERGPKSP